MTRLLLLVAVLFISEYTFAQVRATTESGNKVLLFDNGTWKYEEKSIAPVEETKAVVAAPIVFTAVDSTREITTSYTELFYLTSPRLERFFGEEKGKIRCRLSCSNTKGVVSINYLWEIPVGDGTRYFGWLKSGSKLIFHLQDGQKVELFVADDSGIKANEKYNYSSISGSTKALSQTQLAALMLNAALKLEVEWKKKNEEYNLDFSNYFQENLPKVF